MSTIIGENAAVFVPKPKYQEIYSTLDQALLDATNGSLMPEERSAAEVLVTSLQAEISLLGHSVGEFVYF